MVIPRSGSRDMPCDVCGAPTDLVDDRFTCTVCGAWAKNSPKAGKLGIMADSRTHQYRSMCWTHYRPTAIRVGWKEYRKEISHKLGVDLAMGDPNYWNMDTCGLYLEIMTKRHLSNEVLLYKTPEGEIRCKMTGRSTFLKDVWAMFGDDEKPVIIENIVRKKVAKPSGKAHGYSHAVVYEQFSEGLTQTQGHYFNAQMAKDWCKSRPDLVKPEFWDRETPPEKRPVAHVDASTGEITHYTNVRTRDMSKWGHGRWLEGIRAFAMDNFGIVIDIPKDPEIDLNHVERSNNA